MSASTRNQVIHRSHLSNFSASNWSSSLKTLTICSANSKMSKWMTMALLAVTFTALFSQVSSVPLGPSSEDESQMSDEGLGGGVVQMDKRLKIPIMSRLRDNNRMQPPHQFVARAYYPSSVAEDSDVNKRLKIPYRNFNTPTERNFFPKRVPLFAPYSSNAFYDI